MGLLVFISLVASLSGAELFERGKQMLVCHRMANRDVPENTLESLREHLSERVAKWWLPDRFAFIDEVPKTSVGKFDKKVLRRRLEDGELEVEDLQEATA